MIQKFCFRETFPSLYLLTSAFDNMTWRRERVIKHYAKPMRLRLIYETGVAAGLAFLIFFMAPFCQSVDPSRNPSLSPRHDDVFELSIVKADIEKIGRFSDARILECSGIVPSVRNADCFWVHNDSGNAAEVYLVNKSGDTKLTLKLEGIKNVDFEDIAIAQPKSEDSPFLIIGDVGDNLRRRETLFVYLIKEPKLDAKADAKTEISSPPDLTIEVEFEQGERHNCEGLAYDVTSNRIVIANKLSTKQILQSKEAALFAFEADFKTKKQKQTAKNIGTVPGQMLTGLDISPDGSQLLLLNYLAGYHLPVSGTIEEAIAKKAYTMFSLPVQRQSEAICFTLDGKRLVTASEGKNVSVYSIKIPE